MILKTLQLGIISTNCYIVMDESTRFAAVIDPADKADKILAALDELGTKLKYIFLTHAHFDHMLAAMDVKATTNAEIIIHSADKELLAFDCVCKFHSSMKHKYKEVLPDILCGDGDEFNIGELTAKFINTPGHTPGSCVILIDDCMFSGDTLFKMECGRCDLYGGNFDDMLKSLKKIYNFEGNFRVFPGHGEDSTLDFERENNPYINQAVNL